MGNIVEHSESIHGTASIRTSFPLYKTSYICPSIDRKILEAFAMQTIDDEIEKFRYKPDEAIFNAHKVTK